MAIQSLAIDLDLLTTCTRLRHGQELCVTFPGGATLCSNFGQDLGDPSTIVASMLQQINTALVPLAPFFDILDVLAAIFECITAIPASLGPPPDPTKISDCIKRLANAIAKILEMIPPFPIFVLVKGILEVIILALTSFRDRILAMLEQLDRVIGAATAAAALGNLQLQASADCALDNLDVMLANLNSELAPLNRLMGLINVLLELTPIGCIPALGGLTELSKPVIDAITSFIELLQQIADAIPVELPGFPELVAGECP